MAPRRRGRSSRRFHRRAMRSREAREEARMEQEKHPVTVRRATPEELAAFEERRRRQVGR